jgi:hypothetical protein
MRIVFCLPGRSYSGQFLACWTNLLSHCIHKGINVALSQRYTSNVYYVRAQCLGANVLSGENQKPFGGKLDYDYIMWIDSDILFTTDQFDRLLSHKKDIVSGLYFMEGGKQFAAVKDWDEEYFKKTGSFRFLEPPDLPYTDLMELSYNGMGFMLMRRGVFEKMTYPWFEPEHFRFGHISDFASEDVSFCRKAQRAGFKIYADPTVIVGHEKTQILMPTVTEFKS